MARFRTKTITTANGTKVTKAVAGESEWQMQAAAVRALRAMPEFGRRFILAADMAAGRRGWQTATIAKATGLVPGFPDLRLYLEGGRLGLIEYKTEKGRLSAAQRDMHASLRRLGFSYLAVVKAASGADSAAQTLSLVRGWLDDKPMAANDNGETAMPRVTKSCGCVFCDIGLVPDAVKSGKPAHSAENGSVRVVCSSRVPPPPPPTAVQKGGMPR